MPFPCSRSRSHVACCSLPCHARLPPLTTIPTWANGSRGGNEPISDLGLRDLTPPFLNPKSEFPNLCRIENRGSSRARPLLDCDKSFVLHSISSIVGFDISPVFTPWAAVWPELQFRSWKGSKGAVF